MFMDGEFFFRGISMFCEGVGLRDIAETHGTPTYVYSKEAIVSRYRRYQSALAGGSHRICFAVKANSNLAVLSALAAEGAGFDIVSGGELYRVLDVGAPASSVVFSGVGKTETEIRFALQAGIHSFNCESEEEIETLSRIAAGMGRTASIAIRVNPDVNAVTHPYISTGLQEHKFGIGIGRAPEIYLRVSKLPGIAVEGVSCHIGSQILDPEPLLEAAGKAFDLVAALREQGLGIQFLDLGGGVGVRYRSTETPMHLEDLLHQIRRRAEDMQLTLMLEPGRSIVAEAGVLLTRVVLVKQNGAKTFVVVDAGMNDLIRPALYQAHHEIVPVERDGTAAPQKRLTVDVVGPVCETGDFFARNREMPEVKTGDLLAVCTAGAYGFTLASNYNSRPRACEVMVSGERVHVARARETYADLIRGERAWTAAT